VGNAGMAMKDMVVRPGAIESRLSPAAWWKTAILDAEALRRAVRVLAENPALDGLLRSGRAARQDRRTAGLSEDGWVSECACGARQPCRHAEALLFRFRKEAERVPELWWIAAGIDPDVANQAIRAERAKMVREESPGSPGRTAAPGEDRWERRAEERVMLGESESGALRMLEEAENPMFWNREIAFADWIRPLLEAVREALERDEVPEPDKARKEYAE